MTINELIERLEDGERLMMLCPVGFLGILEAEMLQQFHSHMLNVEIIDRVATLIPVGVWTRKKKTDI